MFVRLCKFPVLSLTEEENPRGHLQGHDLPG